MSTTETVTGYMVQGNYKVHGRDRCQSILRTHQQPYEVTLTKADAATVLGQDRICRNCGRFLSDFAESK